jgi:predicted dehydrogenase
MKVLIAGLGSIGRRHLRNLKSLGMSDILLFRTRLATLPDDELDGYPVFTDLEEALAQKPDAVIVSNPSSAHMAVAIPAAKAGCHLLIEKPISSELAEILDLQKAVAASGVKVLVGFHFRHHPVLAQVEALLESGAIGRVLSAKAHWGEYLPAWHPWEDYRLSYAARKDLGGGVVNTLSHPLDYLRWLVGAVTGVSALTGHVSELEIDVEDNAEISLTFQNGAIATVHLDYYQRPPSHTLTITCTNGRVFWDNATAVAEVFNAADGSWETLQAPADFERNQLFLEEMRHFLAVCRGEEQPVCTLQDGFAAQAIAQAVHESSAEQGLTVQPETLTGLGGKIVHNIHSRGLTHAKRA